VHVHVSAHTHIGSSIVFCIVYNMAVFWNMNSKKAFSELYS